jgi:hypothetical protein
MLIKKPSYYKRDLSEFEPAERAFIIAVTVLVIALMVAAIIGLSIGVTGLIVYGICWAFGLTFSWKYTLGIYLILVLLNGFVIRIKD